MCLYFFPVIYSRDCAFISSISPEQRESHFGENATFFFLFILQNKARCEIIYTHTYTQKEKETRANTSITKGIA